MALTTILWLASLAACAGSLATGYTWAGMTEVGALSVVLLSLWGLLEGRWPWISDLGIVGCIILAAGGLILGAPDTTMLIAVLAGLSAWDLGSFRLRLKGSTSSPETRWLERRHLAWSLAAVLAGLLVGGTALVIEIRLSFFLAAAAAVMMIYSLRRALFGWR